MYIRRYLRNLFTATGHSFLPRLALPGWNAQFNRMKYAKLKWVRSAYTCYHYFDKIMLLSPVWGREASRLICLFHF